MFQQHNLDGNIEDNAFSFFLLFEVGVMGQELWQLSLQLAGCMVLVPPKMSTHHMSFKSSSSKWDSNISH